ncbi:MAG: hypothetical protein IID46_07590 [Planctomycetes bacterium]|nr:hypothetical protein [Planctomycetota bacterium]
MSDQDEFLLFIVNKLSAAEIPYMITGSFGTNFHGEPRATADIDLVVFSSVHQIQKFIASLEAHLYVDSAAAQTAIETESMFNIIDTHSGWKVDLIARKSRPFSVEEFNRRETVSFQGQEISIISAEDSILSKLEWGKKGESERQFRDAESVAVLQWENLDVEYLKKWARELSVEEELNRILLRAEEIRKES